MTDTASPGPHCLLCGYDLTGIDPNGRCPECGAAVGHSLVGGPMRDEPPSYVDTLRKGALTIQVGVVLTLLAFIGGVVLGFWSSALARTDEIPLYFGVLLDLLTLVSAGGTIAAMFGWWYFSRPLPRGVDSRLRGQGARRLVRASVLTLVATQSVSTILSFAAPEQEMPVWLGVTVAVLGLANLTAVVVSFFASMVYVRWMAPRLPNLSVFKRARRLMWLGPLLMTVGVLLLGIGPLIAVAMYYNLLNDVRKDLVRIRAEQEREGGATMPAPMLS